MPDPKQDPESDAESEPKLRKKSNPDLESDPKQIIPDPQPWFLVAQKGKKLVLFIGGKVGFRKY